MNKYYRINQNIRYPEVRVIDQENKQLGIMSTQEALTRAANLGLDLVEITEKAKPPIVKIIDFQKFKYQEDKKEKAGTNKGGQETKEVRLTPFMAENDLGVKVRQAEKFLKDGDRVKLVVKFRGREITKKEFGEKVMNQALNGLTEVSTVVEEPKYLGKLLIAQVKPKK
ncbi:MAG TPA: translation initiation factor IF-3 [Candidatus Woesebacteria bacterium]|nr:translation initiation factor IF-3 [Candidatus Woesebacteria bacterium]